jgi:membrane protease YdiL (CAAX protease family)
LIAGAVLALPLIAAFRSDGALYVSSALAGEVATLGTVVVWIRAVHKTPLSALGVPRQPLIDAAIGIGVGLALVLVSGYALELIRYVAQQILGHPLAEPEQVPLAVRGTALAALGPVVIVAAPLAEESFFRGFLYQGLRRRLSVPLSATTVSLLFGLAHITGSASLQLVLPLAIVGLGLALAYEARRSLLVSVFAHAAFNVFGYLSLVHGR